MVGLLIARLLGAGILTTEQVAAARIAGGLVAEGEDAEEAIKTLEEGGPEATPTTIPVSSTAIRSVGWIPKNIIIVEFMQRGTYTFDGSYALFTAFIMSASKGKFFNEHFRGRT